MIGIKKKDQIYFFSDIFNNLGKLIVELSKASNLFYLLGTITA